MNKYKKAFNTIYDTLVYYMVRRDESLLHSDNEIYDAQAVLSKLVDKADSFEWIPFVLEKGEFCCPIPEVDEEILVTNGKYVWMDTFIEYGDGYALDGSHEFDEGLAWMPLPEPYKENEDDS